jgi:hypothetical protein
MKRKINEPKTTLKEDLIFACVALVVIPTVFVVIVLIVKGVIWLNGL